MSNNNLAIIIPAYKINFLAEAINSIVNQTNKNFHLYIFNDDSPYDVETVVRKYSSVHNLSYHRFDTNLGKKSLVQHWERCIQKTTEQWLWLFSDDDVMDPQCVEKFYHAINKSENKFDLYRFNTITINENGNIIKINPPHPNIESGLEFLYHRLNLHRLSFAPEYIFSRSIYESTGGFIEFPLAWCSDDATWIKFSSSKGILLIEGAKVSWRNSTINIGGLRKYFPYQKLEALMQFLEWVNQFKKINITHDNKYYIHLFLNSEKKWFYHQLVVAKVFILPKHILECVYRLNVLWKIPRKRIVFKLMLHNLLLLGHSVVTLLERVSKMIF